MKNLFHANRPPGWSRTARWGQAVAALLPLALLPLTGMAQTTSFVYKGSTETYTVPAGVTRLAVTATGGGGGNDGSGGSSAVGAQVSATITVVPGEVLTVVVGGRGGNYFADFSTGTFTGGTGGYNGGGYSSVGNNSYGGGGGATELRRVSGTTADYLTSRKALLIAGGAGGSTGTAQLARLAGPTGGNVGGFGGLPSGGQGIMGRVLGL